MMTKVMIEKKQPVEDLPLRIDVLTALWALTEASLGGVLHAFRIPLTGLFINSSAVVFMILIAMATEKKGSILKATLIVMIVKGMVSPHTPLTAYVAVAFQGLMGEVLLRSKKYIKITAIILGIITLLQSALQKIIVLTIVYGNSLWETIDVFMNFIFQQIPFISLGSEALQFSFWLLSIYTGVHVLTGIVAGIIAPKIPGWLKSEHKKRSDILIMEDWKEISEIKTFKKKRSWVRKPSSYLIISLAGLIVALSYLYPEISESQASQAIIMILRSTCILILWYSLLGPYLLKISQNYLKSKQNVHTKEVEKTLQILVPMRYVINKSWKISSQYSGLKRIDFFIKMSLINILSTEFKSDGTN